MLLLLLLMQLLSQPLYGKLRMKCPLNLDHQDGEKPWSYYRPGDLLIGIVISASGIRPKTLPFNVAPSSQIQFLDDAQLLRMTCNIELVNENPQLLHNFTLGYNIHDNYDNTLGTSDALMDMLSTGEASVPNYSCGGKDKLLALVDGASRDIPIQMSTLAGIYKVPQGMPNHSVNRKVDSAVSSYVLLELLTLGSWAVSRYGSAVKGEVENNAISIYDHGYLQDMAQDLTLPPAIALSFFI